MIAEEKLIFSIILKIDCCDNDALQAFTLNCLPGKVL